MPDITANGITLHYEERGKPSDPVILMIMGFAMQMTAWPEELLDALVSHGFRVVRFDNRDVGLSHKLHGKRPPGIIKMLLFSRLGLSFKTPYRLADMAGDAVGLLGALGIDRAHIVGASMGGMIAQHVAAAYPARCLSLTSVMSSTGHRRLPPAKAEARKVLLSRPNSLEEEDLIAHGLKASRILSGPGFPFDEERTRKRVVESARRCIYPEGVMRQLAAIAADGDRRAMLGQIEVNTLVLHGDDDPLIPVEHGHDTAAHIPGAKLKAIPGWGHTIPLELIDELAKDIADHAHGATGPAEPQAQAAA